MWSWRRRSRQIFSGTVPERNMSLSSMSRDSFQRAGCMCIFPRIWRLREKSAAGMGSRRKMSTPFEKCSLFGISLHPIPEKEASLSGPECSVFISNNLQTSSTFLHGAKSSYRAQHGRQATNIYAFIVPPVTGSLIDNVSPTQLTCA